MRDYMDLLKAVEKTGVRAWLVGDTVRMIETGANPSTLTLALDTQDLDGLARALGTGDVDNRGPFPALRGTARGKPFRAFPLQGGSIEDDLARRDFSIEAVALRSDGGAVDPFNGRLDIRNKVIRLTGDDVDLIRKDPLRVVRMLRFAAELEMDVFWKTDMDTREFLSQEPGVMNAIPQERWGREIVRGMRRRPWRFVRLCDAYGLLPVFLKELDDLKRVPDGKGGTLFGKAMETLRVIEAQRDTHKAMQNAAFTLGGLFCHVAAHVAAQGGEKAADRLVSGYLSSWNVGSEVADEVLAIIDGYRSFFRPMSEEALCRSVLQYSPEGVKAGLEFARCAAQVEGLSFNDVLEDNRWNLKQVMRRFRTVEQQNEGASRFLTGREVMGLLHIGPGRKVGELLDGLDMAVGTGKVNSRAAAEAWLLKNV